MDKRIIFIVMILISLSVSQINIASASPTDEAGSYMVKRGNDLFVYGIADSMVSLANGGNTTIDRTEIPDMTMKKLSYSFNPYEFQFVQDWQNVMIVFYVMILIIVTIIGAVVAYASKYNPEVIHKIYYITRNPKAIALDYYISRISIGIALLIFGIFGIKYIMILKYITSALITNHALTTAPPLTDNMIAYFLMSLSYLILSLSISIQDIIILVFVAGTLGIFALYLIEPLINFVISAFLYFIVILFMQPLLLFVSAIGLSFLKVLPPQLSLIEVLIIVGLFLILSRISVSCILAAGIIKNIVYRRLST